VLEYGIFGAGVFVFILSVLLKTLLKKIEKKKKKKEENLLLGN